MVVTKEKVLSNLFWRFLERTGAQSVALIVSIVLARILSPTDYGIIALITVFINILNVFVDSGLGTALIQKKDADDIDFSTVFYTNIVFCVLLYIIMFFVAPFLATFYKNEQLTSIIRVLSITILISGVKNIQQSYVSKTLQFRKFFFSTLIGTITAAVVGIYMAHHGYGVWALVAQQLTNLAIDTILLWITVKWRPMFIFSFKRLKGLFSYGWKILISALLDTFYTNLRNLIIGNKYTSEDLAFYTKGELFPKAIVGNITNTIDSVLLPTMSAEQDDTERVKQMTRRAIKTSTFCIAPLMMGLAACAPNVISLLLTDKWLSAVPFLIAFCITYIFYPIHTANINAIKAMGRSDLFLKLEILKKIVGLIILFSTMWFGVKVMAYSLLFASVICQLINSWPNKKLLNYGYLEQLKDILPSILMAAGMGVIIYFGIFIPVSKILQLIIQIVLGIVIFVCGSKLFRLESYIYIENIIKTKRCKNIDGK